MNLDDFIGKYGIALFRQILMDPDFNVQLYLNNNDVRSEKIKTPKIQPSLLPIKKISIVELEKYIIDAEGNKRAVDLSANNFIYSEKEIDFINHNEKYFEHPFSYLSYSRNILWSDALIEKYAEKWNWQDLSSNSSINWEGERIARFRSYIDFKNLSGNSSLDIDVYSFHKYENLWHWARISGNPGFVRNLENIILEHPKAVWASEQAKPNESISYDLKSIKPCISSNPGIKWTVSKFSRYRKKIDFWLLSLIGDVDVEVIYQFGNKLNQNYQIGTNFTKYSDWRDDHPIYRNGWENWLMNEKVFVNEKMLYFLSNQKATLIKHSGNARTGHHPYEVELKASNLIPSQSLNLTFKELFYNIDLLPETFFSDVKIDQTIYSKIIKKALKEDDKLLNNVINRFFRTY